MAFRFAARRWDRTALEKGDVPFSMEKRRTVPLFRPRSLRRSAWPAASAQSPGQQRPADYKGVRSGSADRTVQAPGLQSPSCPTVTCISCTTAATASTRGDAVFGARRKKGRARLDGPAGHRARPVPIRSEMPSSGRRPTDLVWLFYVVRFGGDVVHVAHPGQGVPRWCRDLVRRVHDQPGRRHDGQQPADRAHERRLPAARVPRDRSRHGNGRARTAPRSSFATI